ncbi:MFS quinate transporter [Emericellopsis atlantica]|uniref:MFS quinate transporter n=1 Tax=Emericellopsis atlantica TaxID=2614577 RepID=A0A9P7ZCB5_9HYPO|nr:MFS quinate transporter [Emericellopsis atlantica]KAG9249454.1 MFS quinate transporter [Emericellopsis atlantica]
MAGGVKKPVNVFNLEHTGEPAGVFNWRLWFAVVSFGLLGAARGIDEGLISGAFNSLDFQDAINYDSYTLKERANIKANVSAMVQIGSVGGALIAFMICDRIGRIWGVRVLCTLWAIGIAIFMVGGVAGNLGAIYAGRFVAGLGIGQASVIGPVYIAEIAPASVRGLCTCFFSGAVYLGIVLAYFTNYGCHLHIASTDHNQWLVPTSLHIMFSGVLCSLTFFQVESPRYLIKQGKREAAAQVMARLRQQPVDSDYIILSINEIQVSHEHELEATEGIGWTGKLKELFCNKSNLYRLYMSTAVQILAQWSGAGSITLYAPDLFEILGISGSSEGLLVTAVFGIVKLCSAVCCALFLVDFIGRKKALILGIALQAIAMIYVASFLTAVPELGVVDGFILPASKLAASRGAIAMIYISGVGWALGWNTMAYILTAELFPLRIRALATSWVMGLHFAAQYGNTRAVPNMLLPLAKGGISPSGTFWCFAAVTTFGGIWVCFSVPETGGRSLESMDRLFDLPWYKIGLYGNRDAERQDQVFNEKERAAGEELGHGEQIERIEDGKQVAQTDQTVILTLHLS